jgi:hypothetical protein
VSAPKLAFFWVPPRILSLDFVGGASWVLACQSSWFVSGGGWTIASLLGWMCHPRFQNCNVGDRFDQNCRPIWLILFCVLFLSFQFSSQSFTTLLLKGQQICLQSPEFNKVWLQTIKIRLILQENRGFGVLDNLWVTFHEAKETCFATLNVVIYL